MQKILLTDIDDCLVSWSTEFRKYFNKETGHKAIKYSYLEHVAFDHVPFPDLNQSIEDFNSSHHFENLPPKAHSVEIISKFKNEGWTIVGITACGTDAKVQELRWKNMNNLFGDGTFSDIRFLHWSESKAIHLKDFDNCPFVDDNIKHATTALTMGHKPIIIHRSYRRAMAIQDIPYLHNWLEIYKEIQK